MDTRPRRSVLYMPGSNPRALEKGRTLPADGLILDLEDAVAPDAKEVPGPRSGRRWRRRGPTGGASSARGQRPRHALGPRRPRRDGDRGRGRVLLPKVESADMVRRACAVLDAAGGPADLPVWCMMETPRGILHAEEIATTPASPASSWAPRT
jgi:citrate lyase subunit beta/citryl-CoA lyase